MICELCNKSFDLIWIDKNGLVLCNHCPSEVIGEVDLIDMKDKEIFYPEQDDPARINIKGLIVIIEENS